MTLTPRLLLLLLLTIVVIELLLVLLLLPKAGLVSTADSLSSSWVKSLASEGLSIFFRILLFIYLRTYAGLLFRVLHNQLSADGAVDGHRLCALFLCKIFARLLINRSINIQFTGWNRRWVLLTSRSLTVRRSKQSTEKQRKSIFPYFIFFWLSQICAWLK